MVLEKEASICNILNVAWMVKSKHELGNWVDDNNINIREGGSKGPSKYTARGPLSITQSRQRLQTDYQLSFWTLSRDSHHLKSHDKH